MLALISVVACSPEQAEILDLSSSIDEVKFLELRADHKTLLPDGQAVMGFHVVAYGVGDFTTYEEEEENGEIIYTQGTSRDTFEIPLDRLPAGCVKVYDQEGNEVEDMEYSTTDQTVRTLSFYAQIGDLRSNELEITIREIPDESYEEIVVPVIFHVLVPAATIAPSYNVSQDELQRRIEDLNNIFNRRLTTDPNGGNAKITFRLAEYDPNGGMLVEVGKNKVDIDEAWSSAEYREFIESELVWDPTRYLNIWLADASSRYGWPTDRLEGTEEIPGLSTTEVPSFTADDMSDLSDVGLLINISDFLDTESRDIFDISMALGEYYGLLYTDQDDNDDFVDGDNDYCPDTYSYYSGYSSGIYKNNRLYREDENAQYEWFTSFNIMDSYSRKNSVTVDQVKRIRKVLEQCPSRWAYKSSWAFEGRNN